MLFRHLWKAIIRVWCGMLIWIWTTIFRRPCFQCNRKKLCVSRQKERKKCRNSWKYILYVESIRKYSKIIPLVFWFIYLCDLCELLLFTIFPLSSTFSGLCALSTTWYAFGCRWYEKQIVDELELFIFIYFVYPLVCFVRLLFRNHALFISIHYFHLISLLSVVSPEWGGQKWNPFLPNKTQKSRFNRTKNQPNYFWKLLKIKKLNGRTKKKQQQPNKNKNKKLHSQ